MRSTVVLILALLPAVGMGREAVGPAQTPAPGYQVGERLKPAPHAPGRAATRFKEIGWDALVPTSWKPAKIFEGLDLSNLRDGDPRAMRALARLRDEWEKAPVNPAMNGAAVRIPGFVVPLETAGKDLTEFLLVPYFGACIHAPPPPANQIIHVFPQAPAGNAASMSAVWVSGVLETAASDSWMGHSGYRMKAVRVEPYAPGG